MMWMFYIVRPGLTPGNEYKHNRTANGELHRAEDITAMVTLVSHHLVCVFFFFLLQPLRACVSDYERHFY